jgi:ABC-2 type transport system ATP-binding protein
VLFLDEPTVGLDIESRRSIWREVRSLRKRGDVTIVLTTRTTSEEADELCDIVAIVDRGAVRAQGSPEELKRTLGGDVVRARLDAPTAQLKSALSALSGVRGVEIRDGNVLCTVTGGEEQTPKLFAVLQEHSGKVRSFRIEPPSLDDVFLQVTGRTLRDQDAA